MFLKCSVSKLHKELWSSIARVVFKYSLKRNSHLSISIYYIYVLLIFCYRLIWKKHSIFEILIFGVFMTDFQESWSLVLVHWKKIKYSQFSIFSLMTTKIIDFDILIIILFRNHLFVLQ